MGLQQLITAIKAGQQVAAGVVNLPIEEVQQNVLYLWSLIQAAGIGSTVIIPEATVSSDCVVGTPVYFNPAHNQFEKALTGASIDSSGSLAVADTAQVWGVILTKNNATSAELLVYGYAPLDFSAAMEPGQTLQAGTWYLSGITPGLMTRQPPAATVLVLKADGQGNVFVCPRTDDFINGHKHLHFRLKARPSGQAVDPGDGGTHVVVDPNPAIEGWLNADHEMFNGLAPHGAKFGYTLWNNPPLQQAWPPLPPDNAALYQNSVPVPQGDNGLVVFDRNGIWWMSNCYESSPWQPNLNTADSEPFSESDNECPFQYDWTLDLYFIQQAYFSESTVVTSLISKDSRLVITCQGDPTKPASVGPLEIRLALEFLQDNVDPGGWLVIKGWDATNNIFHRGPVATGIYAGSDNVALTSDFQTQEQINAAPAPLTTVHHGRVQITVTDSVNRELDVQLVRLMGAEEQYFQNIMYLGFAAGEETAIRGRIQIPETLDVANPVIQLRLRLIGRSVGNLPAMTLTGCRVPAPGSAVAILPSADTAIGIDTTATLAAANQYIDVLSNSISVVAGDDFLFTLTRLSTDAYIGEVGLLRMAALVSN
jgi:hypothetical protein